ncbi:glycosyltransferase [Nocardioides zeae]|uniref:Glycosyltransferase n=1 Tax=Nocardioides imazamoxiresistens TaxID=3231893 RepID=A0ABU3PTJ6_9ACTN|nr:glycosyltransferase [Nocardioides zeae]MDT9592546.1 glycosyltransferase [Nocardioides zeae]
MSPPLVVYGAGVRFDDVPGTDHHLVRHLARHVDVWWVDPPVSVLRPRGRPGACGDGVRRVPVTTTPLPSRPGGRVLARAATALTVRRLLRRDGRTPLAVVSARPEPHLRDLPARCHVYYATDDFVAGAGLLGLSERGLRHAERRSLARADLAVAVTPLLQARWGPAVPSMVLPNGCDSTRYAGVPDPDPVTEPVAAVVGQLSARIDLALLEAVVDRGRRLLLVGPADPSLDRPRFDRLVERPEVTWLGRRPASELPALLSGVKVGLTPYTDTAFNRASHPLKTLEYLAAGRAVVSTPLPAVATLACPAVATGATPEAFADAVDRALDAPDDSASVAGRKAFAARHDWGVRAQTLLVEITRVAR